MDRGAWRATVHGNTRIGHDLVLPFFSFFLFCVHSSSELMGSTHRGGCSTAVFTIRKKTCVLSGSMQFKSLLLKNNNNNKSLLFKSQLDLETE